MNTIWWTVDPRTSLNVVYSPENIMLLESAFQRGNATCEIQLSGGKYTVNFGKMLQFNPRGGTRRVCREQGVTWQCITENGPTPYDSHDTYKLEKAYLESDQTPVKVAASKGSYEVELSTLKQTNMSTGFKRDVRRTTVESVDCENGGGSARENGGGGSGEISATWEYMGDDDSWHPYDETDSARLEQEYNSSSPGPAIVKISGVDFNVDVAGMVQKTCDPTATAATKTQGVRRLAGFRWECKTDKGWIEYDAALALRFERALLNRLFEVVSTGSSTTESDTLEFSMRGAKYTLDLAGLTQVNKSTQARRDVRRSGGCLWEWKDDGGAWNRYDDSTTQRLELKYLYPDSTATVPSVDNKYTIDIKQMKQTDNKTKQAREVRRLNGFFWAWYNSGPWLFYDICDSAMIERAYQSKSGDPVMLRSGRYEVDAISLRQRNLKSQFLRDVKRVDIKGTSVAAPVLLLPRMEARHNVVPEIPSHWTLDSKRTPILRVPLDATSTEYLEVQAEFAKTVTHTIIGIERIQNMSLWTQYKTKKALMDERLPPSAGSGEKRLFHGTRADTVDKINAQGFNRNFAGQNATVHGRGVYFAVNASYSANNTYSPPDTQGEKRMYFVRVAVGDFCVGCSTDVVPSKQRPGAGSPGDICDSTTNDMRNPGMFVTYHDAQQYPEYLITFKV